MTIDEKRDMVDEPGDGIEVDQPEVLEEGAKAALEEDLPEGVETHAEAETSEAAEEPELEATDDADEFWFDDIEVPEEAAVSEEIEEPNSQEPGKMLASESEEQNEEPEAQESLEAEESPEAPEAAEVEQLYEESEARESLEAEESIVEPEVAEAEESPAEPEVAEAEESFEESKAEEAPEESADKKAPEPQSAAAAIGFKPTESQVKEELLKERQRTTFFQILRRTVFSLVVVAAVAVIVATLILPILQISGTSMTETLQDQDIVAALRGSDCETGDVIAFYYNNKILVKRVIATSGQWVDIDKDGNVYVDNVLIDEPYVSDKALGECNIKLPYQVPEGRIFVMGDHRSVSVDSRSTTVGCIADEQIVGKLLMCVWPLDRFGLVN